MPIARWLVGGCAILLAVAGNAGAQQHAPLVVRVRVTDSANAPVAGAAITVARGLIEVLPEGETDASGVRTFQLDGADESYEVIVRKIGYGRISRFIKTNDGRASLEVSLRRVAQTLDAVKVTAAEDPQRKSYHIDADEIANSPRLLFDGMDILTKLKPDMLYGREPEFCGGAKEVFVNGKRIVFPQDNAMQDARRPKIDRRMKGIPNAPLPIPREVNTPSNVANVMAEIKPEHIEEMNYEDCFSTKVAGLHTSNALFVILKPGIAFEDGRGSYVLDERLPGMKAVAAAPVAQPAPTAAPTQPAPALLAPYRTRLLGVYDELTGEPIDSVSVIDAASGTTALTTKTGTVTLAFLPEGVTTLRIRKAGYEDLQTEVSISPSVTTPITLVLTRPHLDK